MKRLKIGILTYHRSQNYGALLQAIALRFQLQKFGHDVYFIDYWPRHQQQRYAFFSIDEMFCYGFKSSIKYVIKFLCYFKKRKQRINAFENFIKNYIEPYCVDYSSSYSFDLVVYGSDQIWRKQPALANKFNPVYFADNIIQSKNHVAYAASMGVIDMNMDDLIFLHEKLSKFSNIAVREQSLKTLLNNANIHSELVLDPTLLLDKSDYEQLFKIRRLYSGKYIIYYRLLRNSFNERLIEEFAKRNECKLFVLEGIVRPGKGNVLFSADPTEFLSLIKYAEFVFTSSYHGLAFSIIFEKQFFASFATNASRAESLLENLCISDRLLKPLTDDYPDIGKINYKQVDKLMQKHRQDSLNYIDKTLSFR